MLLGRLEQGDRSSSTELLFVYGRIVYCCPIHLCCTVETSRLCGKSTTVQSIVRMFVCGRRGSDPGTSKQQTRTSRRIRGESAPPGEVQSRQRVARPRPTEGGATVRTPTARGPEEGNPTERSLTAGGDGGKKQCGYFEKLTLEKNRDSGFGEGCRITPGAREELLEVVRQAEGNEATRVARRPTSRDRREKLRTVIDDEEEEAGTPFSPGRRESEVSLQWNSEDLAGGARHTREKAEVELLLELGFSESQDSEEQGEDEGDSDAARSAPVGSETRRTGGNISSLEAQNTSPSSVRNTSSSSRLAFLALLETWRDPS